MLCRFGAYAIHLRQRNPALVLFEPDFESLQRGIQAVGNSGITRATKDVVKISVELKHVAQVFSAVFSAGKNETPIRFRSYVVVTDCLSEGFGHRSHQSVFW